MLLMTKELEQAFEQYPLYSQEEKGLDSDVVVKQEDGDWLFYGYCHLFEWEWGLCDAIRIGRYYITFWSED